MRSMNICFKNTGLRFLDKTYFHKKIGHYVLLTQNHTQVLPIESNYIYYFKNQPHAYKKLISLNLSHAEHEDFTSGFGSSKLVR